MNNNPFSEEYSISDDIRLNQKERDDDILKEIGDEIEKDYPLDKPRRYEIRARIIKNEND